MQFVTRLGRFRIVVCLGLGLSALAAAPASAQQHILVSRASDGTPGNQESRGGAISADSVWVVFASSATNLVAGDTNAKLDVFLKNLQTQAAVRVSVATDGSQGTEDSGGEGFDLNEDGSIVAFSSSAALVTADTNTCELAAGGTGPCPDIYVRNRGTNTTTLVSAGLGGLPANARSRRPRISDDGRYVVFSSLASNLVANDTNGAEDVFLFDRQTNATTRISVTSGGLQVDGPSFSPEINGDGTVIPFVSASTQFTTEPDPAPCPSVAGLPTLCTRAFVHDRLTSATTPIRVTMVDQPNPFVPQIVTDFAIDRSGRFIALGVALNSNFSGRHEWGVALYDRGRQQILRRIGPVGRNGDFLDSLTGAALSGNGQVFMHPGGLFQVLLTANATSFSVYDQHTGLFEPAVEGLPAPNIPTFTDIDLSTNGHRGVFTSGAVALVAEDTNSVADVYLYNRDVDNDGMPGAWETQWGLSPTDASDAAGDPDNDARTNVQEYVAGSHPKATLTRYFAEGASNAFFTTRIALLNTSANAANVVVRLLGSEGLNFASMHAVPAQSRVTFALGSAVNVPANDFSTVIESDQPFVADRTMTWNNTGFGSHAETSIAAPALSWFLAEGSTGGAFDLFYLLQNANDTDTTVTINYLRPSPAPVISKLYVVPANSRRTIWVDSEGADLAATDVSAELTATQPIIVERAMYFSPAGQPSFVAGHDGAGVTAASTTWFLAEGATGGFFDEYVLIANPGTADANVTVSYLLSTGERFSKVYPVARQSRRTIDVKNEDARLASAEVSVVVESTQPVIAERAMWWPSPNWYEGHLAVGATTTGTRWGLAEGEIGLNTTTGGDSETFILIANTGNTAGTATVTLHHEDKTTTSQITVPLPANSRTTVPVSAAFPAGEFSTTKRFGAIIESSGVPIVVERAMYTTINGVFWSAGTSSLATKLQ